ncbi:MAG: DivIVA domain-containing protein, partial [Fibrobacteraceae bacterium]|nr:DivIVA domain-containing protein [Fibrobacteraceae bacterium]
MELTPLDIRNQTFHSKRFGGCDPEEVKAFLETAAQAFEQMSRNRNDLSERLKIAEDRFLQLKTFIEQKEIPVSVLYGFEVRFFEGISRVDSLAQLS